jgi:short-subunit dehydrogenase
MEISGASVLVTGASGGLGRALARALADHGAHLILNGRRERELQELADEVGGRAIAADLTDRSALERLVADAGELDIVVANAGIPAAGRLESFSVQEIDRTLDVNLRSAIVLAREALPGMLDRGRGHLVFMSSIAGKTIVPGDSLYHATKFALRGFAAAIRTDLHGSGVGVSCIFPGFIREAGIFADAGVKMPPGVGTRSPDDVARAVVKAIEDDRGEIDVAPLVQRGGAVMGSLFPELTAKTVRRFGGVGIAVQMEERLRPKR